MQTVLIILGVLGFGAVVISAYVFTVAARNYVSEKHGDMSDVGVDSGEKLYVVRNSLERRKRNNAVFPLELGSGEVIHMDRRRYPERRIVG